jgi:hypothetical protein
MDLAERPTQDTAGDYAASRPAVRVFICAE